jgi:type IV secretion system protein TrbI
MDQDQKAPRNPEPPAKNEEGAAEQADLQAAAIGSAPTGIALSSPAKRTKLVSMRGLIVAGFIAAVAIMAVIVGVWRKQQQTHARTIAAQEEQPTTLNPDAAEAVVHQLDKERSMDIKQPGSPTAQSIPASTNPEDEVPLVYTSDRPKRAGSPDASFQQAPNTANTVLTPEQQQLQREYDDQQAALTAPLSVKYERAAGSQASSVGAEPDSAGDSLQLLVKQVAGSVRGASGSAPALNAATSSRHGYSTIDQNGQDQKEEFLTKARSTRMDDNLPSFRAAPMSRYVLTAGTRIPAVLDQAINSDLPGEMIARVRNNVYYTDAAGQRYLMIPQNSQFVGRYNSSIVYGQERVQVVWDRIIFPDKSSIDLLGMNGQDSMGATGLHDKVNTHWRRMLADAAITSMFAAGIEITQRQNQSAYGYPTVGQTVSQAIGQQLGEVGMEMARRNLSRQPTLKIREGTPFFVFVNRDILFDAPYSPMSPADGVAAR